MLNAILAIERSHDLHAKVYIMTFAEGGRNEGRVNTGSSNLTQSGLQDNLEFNVEFKNRSDYDFATGKFNGLPLGRSTLFPLAFFGFTPGRIRHEEDFTCHD
jgi:phosphatidylserine/phosphatidylglycerophosphate/cardiolipin synthase-like enzyme